MKNILDKINRADEIQAKKTELSKWQEEVLLMTEKDNLSKHQIELSNIQDLENYVKESLAFKSLYDKIIVNSEKIEQEKKKLYESAIELSSKWDKLNFNGQKSFSDFAKKAKELGIDPNSSKAYKDAESIYNKNIDLLDKLLKVRTAYGTSVKLK